MVSDERAAGVSVLIWKDGREAYFGAAGYTDLESDRKMARGAGSTLAAACTAPAF